MKAEITHILQRISLKTGKAHTFILLHLQSGLQLQLEITEEDATNILTGQGGEGITQQQEQQEQQEQEDASSAVERMSHYTEEREAHVWGDDAVAVGEVAAPPPSRWREEVPTGAPSPSPAPPVTRDGAWIDPVVQMREYRRGKVQARPSRTVPTDDMGNPIVRNAGGVDVDQTIRARTDGDEDGVGSI